MDATLIKALQLVLSLSILVVLHEGGHFFFSKLFRVKVEKFFLFFDPYFHLFSTLAVDGEEIRKWDGSVYRAVSEAREVTVLRGGKEANLTMPEDMNMLEMLKSNPPFMVPFIPSVIDSVLPSSPVYEAGIRSGDRIVAMDGKPVATWSDFDEIMRVRM